MTTEITGIFEHVDAAEIALSHLREMDIHLLSYRIRPFHKQREHGGFSALGVYPAPSATSDTTFMNGVYMAAPIEPLTGRDEPEWREGPSEEVILHLLVDEYNAKRAKNALISNHGRQVSER